MTPELAIFAQGLKKSFKDVAALKGVDLILVKGTILALLGPNGAGKTTLVRIFTTLLRPDAGQAQVMGYDVVREASKVRTVIGLSGQYASVDENLTGRENLEMVGQLYHLPKFEARKRTQELLDMLELQAFASRRVKTYSGGMRRRLDLAASLIGRPKILFLDEPTTELDPKSRAGLWKIIKALTAEGTSLLLTTQYLEEADRLADWIAVIDHGRLIAQGSSRELKSRVGGDILELHITEPRKTVSAARAILNLGSDKPKIDQDTGRVALPVNQGATLVAEVVRRLDAQGITIADLAMHRPTLDDVFLVLTGHPTKKAGEGEKLMKIYPPTLEQATGGNPLQHGQYRPPLEPSISHAAYLWIWRILFWAITDILVITKRNLVRYTRIPQLLVFSTIQPVMFVLLFSYVFGGAIQTPGMSYINFLIPGIIVQTVIFGAIQTGIGLADDLSKGMIDRFRSLPMARSAVLAGRTLSDTIRNIFVILLMTGIGYLIGFRFQTGFFKSLAALGLALLFGFAFSWISATIGLLVKETETAQVAGFVWVFPLVFASSIFVPVETMPSWLAAFAKISPITVTVNSVRALALGGNFTTFLLHSLIWIGLILLVFMPLAVTFYRRGV